MKFNKSLIFFIMFGLWLPTGLAMEELTLPTRSVKAYFLPESQKEIYPILESFLDEAKERVLIAMYWLTYTPLIDKLISLKKRGIDVQIILDDEMLYKLDNGEEILNTFLANNIIPIVSPSSLMNGRMHNKFVVIDNAMVWTGSANFTKTVLDPGTDFLNNENIVIHHSEYLAKEFIDAFERLESNLMSSSIEILAETDPNELADWFKNLNLLLYEHNPRYAEMLEIHFDSYDEPQQDRLQNLFLYYKGTKRKSTREDEPTEKQKRILEQFGIPTEGMSKEEAFSLIGKLFKRGR